MSARSTGCTFPAPHSRYHLPPACTLPCGLRGPGEHSHRNGHPTGEMGCSGSFSLNPQASGCQSAGSAGSRAAQGRSSLRKPRHQWEVEDPQPGQGRAEGTGAGSCRSLWGGRPRPPVSTRGSRAQGCRDQCSPDPGRLRPGRLRAGQHEEGEGGSQGSWALARAGTGRGMGSWVQVQMKEDERKSSGSPSVRSHLKEKQNTTQADSKLHERRASAAMLEGRGPQAARWGGGSSGPAQPSHPPSRQGHAGSLGLCCPRVSGTQFLPSGSLRGAQAPVLGAHFLQAAADWIRPQGWAAPIPLSQH
ncbi:uncharacterized protein LOC134473805 [Cavia porcellus]|uniref:uncharacterized protein LOC134473805 n=1 Tax=Cavia porcellus TaxID=10141 RepID=UPI002FE24AF3